MKLHTLYREAIITKSRLKKDKLASRDLEKDNKSVTAFLKNNYQKIMNLTANTNNLKKYLKTNFIKLHVSDIYRDKMFDKLNNNTPIQNQFYLTNALLKGKGLGLR